MNGQEIHFGWIEACLRYGGVFGPSEKVVYQNNFGLSEASVSRHQAGFARDFERAVGRVLVRDQNDRPVGGRLELVGNVTLPSAPVFEQMPSLQVWLKANLWGGRYIEVEVERREPELWIVRSIFKAIKSKTPICVRYHSKNNDSTKVLSPHSIVHVVGRMHVRAFDHGLNDYFDYVMSRIVHVEQVGAEPAYANKEEDRLWSESARLQIKFRQGGSPISNLTSVQLDYGVDSHGTRGFRVKKAVAKYLIDDIDHGFEAPVTVTSLDPL